MNYALLVEENKYYEVLQTSGNEGKEHVIYVKIKGGDLTENQIKKLYFSSSLKKKPTELEINNHLDKMFSF